MRAMTAAASPATPTVDDSAAALRSLYEEHGRPIFSFCLHRLGSREDAEDALQTTFLNAFRGLSRGMLPRDERAWLFAIAQNVCHDRNTSSWKRQRLECKADLDVLAEVVPSPRAADSPELFGLDDALAAMPEKQRRAILLREWQGLSYREISDELALSQSAVETLIFRARRTLANGLEAPVRKRRLASGLDLSSVLAALKSLLSGGAVVKAAAIAAAAGTATVVATKAEHRIAQHKPAVQHTKAAVVRSAPADRAPPATAHAAPVQHAPAAHAVRRHTVKKHTPVHAAPAAPQTTRAEIAPVTRAAAAKDRPAKVEHAPNAAPATVKAHGKKAHATQPAREAAVPKHATGPTTHGNAAVAAEHGKSADANAHAKK
jgi:RNA polymerase sigma factor (sigma-70 family)